MRIQLSWHNLIHDRRRTCVGLAGVTFAVILVFMQLGFLGSVSTTATLIYDNLDFDVLIRSKNYLHFSEPRTFPRSRLHQAAGIGCVREAVPLYVILNSWRNLNPTERDKPDSNYGCSRGILTMGVRTHDRVFADTEKNKEIQEKMRWLTDRRFVLIDRKTRKEFGPRNLKEFSDDDIGAIGEVVDKSVEIVGHFELGTGLAADGAILVNVEGYSRLLPGHHADQVSLGLVRLQEGFGVGSDPEAAAQLLRTVLPRDVEVLTRDGVMRFERHRWVWETSIGVIFFVGVVVSFFVGIAIVYQVLSSDIASHMAEYATLKAIGYTSQYLRNVVLKQALIMSLIGFVIGLGLSEVLYRITASWAQNLPIAMTGWRIGGVLVLTVVMCVLSALLAVRKLDSVEPVDLF
jgi:putative ABC transport system permease protein